MCCFLFDFFTDFFWLFLRSIIAFCIKKFFWISTQKLFTLLTLLLLLMTTYLPVLGCASNTSELLFLWWLNGREALYFFSRDSIDSDLACRCLSARRESCRLFFFLKDLADDTFFLCWGRGIVCPIFCISTEFYSKIIFSYSLMNGVFGWLRRSDWSRGVGPFLMTSAELSTSGITSGFSARSSKIKSDAPGFSSSSIDASWAILALVKGCSAVL